MYIIIIISRGSIYYDMCGVVCIRNYYNSYLRNYTYITCHTKQTPIAICNIVLYIIAILFKIIVLTSLTRTASSLIDTDNTHCLDIYYHLKVPKVLTQYKRHVASV